jgi:hypothetical protein
LILATFSGDVSLAATRPSCRMKQADASTLALFRQVLPLDEMYCAAFVS